MKSSTLSKNIRLLWSQAHRFQQNNAIAYDVLGCGPMPHCSHRCGRRVQEELWNLKEKKLLRLLTSSKDKHIQSVAFSMNDTAVVIEEEGGVASLFDAKDGSPLAQHISAASVYYYDPDLRRIHLWNSSGQVIRHVEGRSYFGWFVPTKKGAME